MSSKAKTTTTKTTTTVAPKRLTVRPQMSRKRAEKYGIVDRVTIAPTAVSNQITTGAAQITSKSGTANCRVVHREEIIGSIPGAATFTIQGPPNAVGVATGVKGFALNPGLRTVFPYLSQIAQRFEFYKFNMLKFDYIPIVPTSTQGTVMLSPDYDAADAAPVTETDASDNVDTIVDSCWKNICCKLDSRAMLGGMTRKYVRSVAVASDVKSYDSGVLYLCTNNFASSALPLSAGKLFVSYDVELYKPSLNAANGLAQTQRTSYWAGPGAANQVLPVNAATYLTGFGSPFFDPLGIGAQIATGTYFGSWLMPRGVYKVILNASFKGTGPTSLQPDLVEMFCTMFKNGSNLAPNVVSTVGGDEYGTWYYTFVVTGLFTSSGNDYMSFNAYPSAIYSTVVALQNQTTLIVELA